MSAEMPSFLFVSADPGREPLRVPPITHLLRQSLQERRENSPDWAEISARLGIPEARVRSVAGFFEEFDDNRTPAPPFSGPIGSEVRCLAAKERLIGPDGSAEAYALARASWADPLPPETMGNRLRAVKYLDRHRVKQGRPLSARWTEAASVPANRRFVICHADPGNPGAHGGDWLLDHRPGAVVAGLALAAALIGAKEGIICVDRARAETLATLRREIDRATSRGELGTEVSLSVLATFGSHVGGEETALLNAIEGNRGEARMRPPEPESAGLFGCPTLIETAEIFAMLPDWWKRGRDDGNRLISLLPPFSRPGLVEIDAGVTVDQLIGAGEYEGETLAAVLIGGSFGGLVFPEDEDLPMTSAALSSRGFSLGNGSLEPVPADTPFADFAERSLAFAATESCGRCTPCRLGPLAAREKLKASGVDAGRLREILETVAATSLCGFGRDFPGALLQWLDRWGLAAAAPPNPAPEPE